MTNPFSVQISLEGDPAVVRLDGYVDAHTAPQFEQAVQSVIAEGQHRIIVDCEKLSYISSAGLGVFMGFIEEVREEGGDIKICGLTEKARQPFDILGFEDMFDFCPDVESARTRFAQSIKREA